MTGKINAYSACMYIELNLYNIYALNSCHLIFLYKQGVNLPRSPLSGNRSSKNFGVSASKEKTEGWFCVTIAAAKSSGIIFRGCL